MKKTNVIGHRGAAGLAPENSLASIRQALELGIDALEFDIRRTRDGKLVVLHDPHTGRVAEERVCVKDKTSAELGTLQFKDGRQMPALEEVLELIGGKKPVVIDIKDAGCSSELLTLLKKYPAVKASFTSLINDELQKLHQALPDVPICVRDLYNPFLILHTAQKLHAEAISLNMRLINPLTFYLAKRRGLEVRIYTVNGPRLAHFFCKLYPGIVMYTDYPNRLLEALHVGHP